MSVLLADPVGRSVRPIRRIPGVRAILPRRGRLGRQERALRTGIDGRPAGGPGRTGVVQGNVLVFWYARRVRFVRLWVAQRLLSAVNPGLQGGEVHHGRRAVAGQ